MDQITASLLETFVNANELRKENLPTQFEHFVNYCIISKLNRTSFDLDDVHTGDGGDCAVDGLSIVVNGKIVTDPEEVTDLVNVSKYLDAEIVFIQTKTTSSFDAALLGAFITGVKDFLSEIPRLVQNEKIKALKAVWERVISLSAYMVNRRPICRMYYVCTGRWVDDAHLVAIIQTGVNEIDGYNIFETTNIYPFGGNEIQKLYRETTNKLSATITFQNRITLPDIGNVGQAYLGVIPFKEFIKLIQDDNQTIHSIFDDNVRDFQGENDVNKKIKSTLDSGNFDLFCVLNNGITVVATSITPVGDKFTLRDYQIVNGCQTSNVLHGAQNIPGVDLTHIPIKIIVTDNDEVKTQITLATNSQTAVKTEEMEALNAFQKQLELYFQSEQTEPKLYYERRSQQYNSYADIKRAQIISIPIQIKAFASMFLKSPHLVSGYYGTIVNRFKGQIFAENHKFLPYYVSALCYFKCDQLLRAGEFPSEFKKARFHIMMIAKIIGMGVEDDLLNSHKIDQKCKLLKDLLFDEKSTLCLFDIAIEIFKASGIDVTKSQYKSESDTELLINAANDYVASGAKITDHVIVRVRQVTSWVDGEPDEFITETR